jgi:hypothetical protein
MGSTPIIADVPQALASGATVWAQGDAAWAGKTIQPRESDVAMAWPEALLDNFCQNMARHGRHIQRAKFLCDRQYAVQQMLSAYTLPDDELHGLAAKLFFHFKERQADRPPLH